MGVDAAVTEPGVRSQKPGARIAGSVAEERPNAVYVVALDGERKILAHAVGAVERNFVRLVPGDRVEVELSEKDPTRGRILKKL